MNKKILILMIFICYAITTSAAVTVSAQYENARSNPNRPIEGEIRFVHYQNHPQPKIVVDIDHNHNERMNLTFTDADLPAGFALIGAVGQSIVVSFQDDKFTFEDFFMEKSA